MDEDRVAAFIEALETASVPEAELELRSLDRREIAMRIVPWEVPALTRAGPEVIMRGAFGQVDASKVVLQLEHENPPAGRGIQYEDRSDGAYMVFRVFKTQRGDDILTLASDGVASGASITYTDKAGGVQTYHKRGQKLRVVEHAALKAVSTTWQPSWAEAAVQEIRSRGEVTVADESVLPPEPVHPAIDMDKLEAKLAAKFDGLSEKLAVMEERSRQEITVPAIGDDKPDIKVGDWMDSALRMLMGERLPQAHMRALEDLTTTDNIGVVPDAFLPEIVGVIDASRPFLGSTRRLALPAAGMNLVVPVIETRPTVARQTNGSGTLTEKAEIDSTATSITTDSFEAISIAGGGDVSLQLLRRSSPSFLGLYLELLAEALSQNAESEAINALLTAPINGGGTIDPELLNLGAAWQAGAALHKPPTNMWMSSAAVGAFIDAKADGSNMPLYSSIQAGFSASNGAGGIISGLRPIHVPALDDTDTDVVVGPSTGFAWTEDGSFTLQVDVPSKLGRDVALASIFWFAPLYPGAFTGYTLGS
jgi:phage head maturation protease